MLNPFMRRSDPHTLAVSMTGVKMGDRLVQVGCAHAGRLGAIAAKVGLSGRAVAVVPDEAAAERARKGAADAGVLVDVEMAPATQLPLDAEAFDLAIIDDTGGLLSSLAADRRAFVVRETLRVLRAGGRAVVIGAGARGGLAALLGRGSSQADPQAGAAAVAALSADGFKSVRLLAQREGLSFVEGIKPRE